MPSNDTLERTTHDVLTLSCLGWRHKCTFCRAYLGVNALLLFACLVLLWLSDGALATTTDALAEARRLTNAEREERRRRRLRKLHAEQWAAVIADADDKGLVNDYRCAWKAGAGVRVNADNAAAWVARGYRIELPCCVSHGGPRYNDAPPLGAVATCDCVPSVKGCAKDYCYESLCRSCVWHKSAFDACSSVSPYAPDGYAIKNKLGEYALGVVTCGGKAGQESLVKRDVDATDAAKLPCAPVTAASTTSPTQYPTPNPTASPTQSPTASPTLAPTNLPDLIVDAGTTTTLSEGAYTYYRIEVSGTLALSGDTLLCVQREIVTLGSGVITGTGGGAAGGTASGSNTGTSGNGPGGAGSSYMCGGSGGGFGGDGGVGGYDSGDTPGAAGAAYGSPADPSVARVGRGGGGVWPSADGAGGACITLAAPTISATVESNGGDGDPYPVSGTSQRNGDGGSGGGIFARAVSLTGSSFTAAGGKAAPLLNDYDDGGGGGGGGRIWLRAELFASPLTTNVAGGKASAWPGTPDGTAPTDGSNGTVHTQIETFVPFIRQYKALNWNVRLVFFATAAARLSSGIWQASMLTLYVFLLTDSAPMIGYMAGVNGATLLLLSLFSSRLIDRFGRVPMLRTAAVVLVVAAMLTFVAVVRDDWRLLMAGLAIFGAFNGIFDPALESIFADSVASGARSHVYAAKYSVGQVAYAAGPVVSIAMLLGRNDWTLDNLRPVLLVGLSLSAPTVLCSLLFRQDRTLGQESEALEVVVDEKELMQAAAEEEETATETDDGGVPSVVTSQGTSKRRRASSAPALALTGTQSAICCTIRAPHVPYILASSNFITGLGAGLSIRYFPLLLEQRYQLSPIVVQLVQALSLIGVAVSSMLAQRVSRTWLGRLGSALIFQFIGIALIFTMAFYPPAAFVCAFMVVRTATQRSASPLFRAVIMDTTPKRRRGLLNSAESIAWGLTGNSSAILGGLIVERYGYAVCFITTAVIYTLSTLPTFLVIRLVPREERK